MHIRTWHIELAAVTLTLSIVAIATGSSPIQWIGVGAVALSFAHAQVAERMAEREAKSTAPDVVECYYMTVRYLVGKEILWCCYFILLHAWTALVGVGLFLLYPLWRRWWRKRHPVGGRTRWFTRRQRTYDELKAQLQELLAQGRLHSTPTFDERVDFAYSNTRLSNPHVTREMVERAALEMERAAEAAKPYIVVEASKVGGQPAEYWPDKASAEVSASILNKHAARGEAIPFALDGGETGPWAVVLRRRVAP